MSRRFLKFQLLWLILFKVWLTFKHSYYLLKTSCADFIWKLHARKLARIHKKTPKKQNKTKFKVLDALFVCICWQSQLSLYALEQVITRGMILCYPLTCSKERWRSWHFNQSFEIMCPTSKGKLTQSHYLFSMSRKQINIKCRIGSQIKGNVNSVIIYGISIKTWYIIFSWNNWLESNNSLYESRTFIYLVL